MGYRSVANDTHLFNIRYYEDGRFWNPQYQIAPMDDGNGEDCEICPLWRHTITVLKDVNKEVLFAAYGFRDERCTGNGKTYQYEQSYGMPQGRWIITRDSPRFLGLLENLGWT